MDDSETALVLECTEEDEEADFDRSQNHDCCQRCFNFVEAGCFQAISACVILGNTIVIFIEASDPSKKEDLQTLDLASLWFYIFELMSRLIYFRAFFFCGPARSVSWNLLDMTVVSAGAFDEFLIPMMPSLAKDGNVKNVIQILRMLRLLRMLKMVRIFLESDLSWTERPRFQSFIGLVIAFNALLMGLETDLEWGGFFFIEQVLLIIYVFELMVRLKRFGFFFLHFRNPDFGWNTLDFTIVFSSVLDSWLMPLIDIVTAALVPASDKNAGHEKQKGLNLSQVMMLMRMLRLMRILRLVKLVKTFKPLYILVTGVAAAVQGVMWVLVLTVVVLYAIGIVATRIIGHGLIFPESEETKDVIKVFATVSDSMFVLFRVMSGSQSNHESMAIDQLMVCVPSVKFAFVFFMVTSSWTLLSILTAVVSDCMIATTGTQEEEMRIQSAEEDRQQHLQDLQDLFSDIDAKGTGCVDFLEMETFLSVKDNALRTAKLCRVPARNVLEVLKTLALDGTPVHLDTFLECMLEVSKPVTEQSMMKMTAIVNEGQKKVSSDVLEAINNLALEQNSLRNRQRVIQVNLEEQIAMVERSANQGMDKLEGMIDHLKEGLRGNRLKP